MRRFALASLSLLALIAAGCTTVAPIAISTVTSTVAKTTVAVTTTTVTVAALSSSSDTSSTPLPRPTAASAESAPSATKPENPSDFVSPDQVRQLTLPAESGHYAVTFPVLLDPYSTVPTQLKDVTPYSGDNFGSLIMAIGDPNAKLGSRDSAAIMFSDLWTNQAKTMYCNDSNIDACDAQNLESYSLYVYKVDSTNAKAAFEEVGSGSCPAITNSHLNVPTVSCSGTAKNWYEEDFYTPGQVFELNAQGRYADQFINSFRFLD